MSPIQHLLLDRDGVLNVEAPDRGHVTDPADWRWMPGALDALATLGRSGLRLSLCTNQSVVGRGGASRAQVDAVLARMEADAAAAGARFAHIGVCPHAPGAGCPCRKPAPGLLLDAVARSGIAADHTAFVGDSPSDLQAALAAGVQPVLVRTGKGAATEVSWTGPSVPTFADLPAAVAWILAGR